MQTHLCSLCTLYINELNTQKNVSLHFLKTLCPREACKFDVNLANYLKQNLQLGWKNLKTFCGVDFFFVIYFYQMYIMMVYTISKGGKATGNCIVL